MSYTTATVKAADAQPGRLHATVVMTGDSGEPVIVHDFFAASLVDLQQQAASFLATLNVQATDVKAISPGMVLSAPAKAIEVATVLSDEQQWFLDADRLSRVQRFVDLGVVPADDPTYLALKDSLTKAFQSAWISDSGWPR